MQNWSRGRPGNEVGGLGGWGRGGGRDDTCYVPLAKVVRSALFVTVVLEVVAFTQIRRISMNSLLSSFIRETGVLEGQRVRLSQKGK